MKSKRTKLKRKPLARSVLDMTAKQARSFFLKSESYCRLDLPPYFDFGRILRPLDKFLGGRPLAKLKLKPRSCEGVNYTIYSNKDGRYAWRPFQLIHPAIYVDLVHLMTEAKAWATIKSRFKEFARDSKLNCLSIPQESLSKRKDQGAQILHWWHGIEQASIELALDYNYVFHADIADCYASIYTHSIAWALHEKSKAKTHRRDPKLIGNAIDGRIQDMQHGQTNGIPQGSVLIDLIAELVLGYADLELSQRLNKANVTEFRTLRYRDDYRIFVNNPESGEFILKTLTEVLMDLGLKLSVSKTTGAQSVIDSSLKPDKSAWMRSRQRDGNLQKHLMLIHHHGSSFPNAGSLIRALDDFYTRLGQYNSVPNPLQLISITVDIAYNSPRCFPVSAAIVSRLLESLENKKAKIEALQRIRRKLSQLPNNGHLELWIQRITYPIEPKSKRPYQERLCSLVEGKAIELWENSWITDAVLKGKIDPRKILNKSRLKALKPIVQRKEFTPFDPY